MARKHDTPEELKEQLWAQLDKGLAVMLWLPESEMHPQPMTVFPDKEAGAIWFITSSETDLAQALVGPRESRMTFVSSKQDYHASVDGRLEVVNDNEKLDELWSVGIAAWFEHGRDDPHVRLLRFTPKEAAVWASDSSSVLVGLKILRAGMQDGEAGPDVGIHEVVEFHDAA